jgi:hypothetical protein
MSVFVLDESGEQLAPCTERRARILLERNRASVVSRNPFTIRLVGGVAMSKQENSISNFSRIFEAIDDPIQSWSFDVLVDGTPLWLVSKVRIESGKMHINQVLTDSGIYDLSGKLVVIRYYSDAHEIVADVTFQVNDLIDVNLQCDGISIDKCAEIELIHECAFVSAHNCAKNSA